MKYPKYPEEAAFPQPATMRTPEVEKADVLLPQQWGLTKLELFTAFAMNGLVAGGVRDERMYARAVQIARDQLAELEEAQS